MGPLQYTLPSKHLFPISSKCKSTVLSSILARAWKEDVAASRRDRYEVRRTKQSLRGWKTVLVISEPGQGNGEDIDAVTW
jgi:hypothetical protein